MRSGLTKKRELFCKEYMKCLCVDEAFNIAGIDFGATYGNKFYVYLLVNPLTDRIFYIGKGKGKRAEGHLKENRTGKLSNHKKHQEINKIRELGYDPEVIVFKNNLTESEALKLEHYLIDKLRKFITNIQSGNINIHEKNKVWAQNQLNRGLSYEDWLALRPRLEAHKILYREIIKELKMIASGEKKWYSIARSSVKNGVNTVEFY